jgi:hypothetical protein
MWAVPGARLASRNVPVVPEQAFRHLRLSCCNYDVIMNPKTQLMSVDDSARIDLSDCRCLI